MASKKQRELDDNCDESRNGIRNAILCVCAELKKLNEFLRAAKYFTITQQGEAMGTINGIKVGGTGSFTATPQPPGSSVPAGTVPTWTSSDTANTTLTPSGDGLSVNVAVGANAPVGGKTTLQVSATSPDGSQTALGSADVPYLGGFPTSFDINQTA